MFAFHIEVIEAIPARTQWEVLETLTGGGFQVEPHRARCATSEPSAARWPIRAVIPTLPFDDSQSLRRSAQPVEA